MFTTVNTLDLDHVVGGAAKKRSAPGITNPCDSFGPSLIGQAAKRFKAPGLRVNPEKVAARELGAVAPQLNAICDRLTRGDHNFQLEPEGQ